MKNKIKYAVIIFIIGGIIMYTRVNWQNAPSTATPVNAENLNTMDKGIADAHSQLAENANQINSKILNINEKSNTIIPVVTFIDDDGNVDVYNRLLPIFTAKNVGFGSAIITGMIDNNPSYMTLSQLKHCHENGLETLSHCVDVATNLTDGYTDAQIDAQLKDSQTWLKDNGFEYEGFVYPQSGHNLKIRKMVRVYYDYAFADNKFNDEGYLDHSRISRIAFGSWTDSNPTVNGNSEKNTLAYYKACVDYAIANNLWLVFMLHINQQPIDQDTILGELIDYIKLNNVQILKPSEAFKLKGNKFSFGDKDENHIWIGENGVKSNMLTVWESLNGRTNDSPISSYKQNQVTINTILTTDSDKFPVYPGILQTYRNALNDNLSYQIFVGSKITQKRTWTGTGWSAWTNQNIVFEETDAYTSDNSKLHFPRSLSICKILNNKEGFPLNQAGTLVTDRISNSTGFDSQMYFVYNKSEIWHRYAISNSAWSEWKCVSLPGGHEVFSITMPEQVIPANACVDVILPWASITVTDYITGNPMYGLPPGLIYSVMVLTNGQITVRIFNASSSDKTITSRGWKFQKNNII